ncbi:MAG: DPP IV N-terminal domain-containing protein [Bacteroidetes bacterium]|nr:DPP IV N-terminal domain-containing protein [Bacteroidota bacterium]
MKKIIFLASQLCIALVMNAQMPNSNMPRFNRWLNNDEFVINTKLAGKTASADYVYNINTKQYTPAPPLVKEEKLLTVKDGDLFVKINGVDKQITSDKKEKKNPTLSPDGQYVAYTQNNNLYTVSVADLKLTAITNETTKGILNGYASWVYFEEIFGRPTQYRAFWWSPDSKFISFMRFDERNVPMFPIYNSEGQHGFVEETRYPKVGDPNPTVKIGWVAPTGGNITWADFNDQEDQYFGWPIWNPNNNKMWLSWMDRGQNNLKMYELDMANGSKKEVYKEYQKTWIDLEDRVGGRINFLANNKGYIAQSDQTGWNQLYLYQMDGQLLNPITNGKFTVTGIKLVDEKAKTIYFTARGVEHSTRIDLYAVGMDGKNFKRLTAGEYNHTQTNLSPDAKHVVSVYSNVTTPTTLGLIDVKSKSITTLGSSVDSNFKVADVAKTELIYIKSEDGLYELPALVTWPKNMDPTKKYPLLVSIYGGPNAGTVMDSWNYSSTRENWAKEGLIQVAFDHRASGHFGKEGVNYMYRNLGYWEMKDYMTMAKWFIANGKADSTKICITGFSYGGYMSCYALTYGASVFTHAMAGGSVTSWELYDSHYTERYMDTPKENPEGYKSSSAMTFAKNYKGVLQLVHGTMDDNVHLQNSMQLLSALEDNGKEVEFMLYPGGRHGWGGAKGKHFTDLKNKFIYKYLLEKPVPSNK